MLLLICADRLTGSRCSPRWTEQAGEQAFSRARASIMRCSDKKQQNDCFWGTSAFLALWCNPGAATWLSRDVASVSCDLAFLTGLLPSSLYVSRTTLALGGCSLTGPAPRTRGGPRDGSVIDMLSRSRAVESTNPG